jgi:DNA-binding winged helix-turn-helix (wHTH) protein
MARIGFGDCVLDTRARTLTRRGAPVRLTLKALLLLETLLERRPAAASHQELRDLLWPKTYVGRTSLARLVTQARKATGDHTHAPRFVRTVRGFGYAFAGAAEDLGAPPPEPAGSPYRLRSASGEATLSEGENLIGRGAECRVRIVSDMVSRRHARLVVSESRVVLEDLGSKNGTQLNGRRLGTPAELSHGDEIMVGHEVLVFTIADTNRTTRTDVVP